MDTIDIFSIIEQYGWPVVLISVVIAILTFVIEKLVATKGKNSAFFKAIMEILQTAIDEKRLASVVKQIKKIYKKADENLESDIYEVLASQKDEKTTSEEIMELTKHIIEAIKSLKI